MTDDTHDLIPMADIARLAGQSRATVGNWKSRYADFPPERGRTSRGPLYNRTEVIEWLEQTNRLDRQSPEAVLLGELTNIHKGGSTAEEIPALTLVVLALKTMCSEGEWERLKDGLLDAASADDQEAVLRQLVQSKIPFAQELLPWERIGDDAPLMDIMMIADNLDFVGSAGTMADVLMEQFAATLDRHHGEYLTPSSVRKLVTGLAHPEGITYNPASGMGQLLVDAAASAKWPIEVGLFAQEVNSRAQAMSRLNLAIHGVQANIAAGDAILNDAFPDLRAYRIVSVPPWNTKIPELSRMADDPRWIFGEPGPNDGNSAWIQHCLYHLSTGGRAVLVLPKTAVFEGGRAGRIRQRIVKAGLLDAVIALPPGLFAWTQIPSAVLVFSKPSVGQHAQSASLVVDLSMSGERQIGHKTTILGDHLIDDVAQTYRRWTEGEPPEIDNAAVAEFDDIAANNFEIIPSRYLSVVHDAPDIDEAWRKKRDLLRRLETLSAASRVADERLKKLLGVTR